MVPRKRLLGRGVVFFLAALWWTLVFASNVTGTVVAMGIGTLGVALLFREQAYRWLGVQTCALVVGIGLYVLLFHLVAGASPEMGDRLSTMNQNSWRIQRWMTSLELMRMNPWLGVGPMHYAWAPYHFGPAAHPHNAFFQWLAEWGIPATLILGGLAVWAGWAWIRQELMETETDRGDIGLRIGLIAAVLAGTAHAMVSGILVMPVSQVTMGVIGGWAWGRYQGQLPSLSRSSSNWNHAVLGLLLALSFVSVANGLRDLSSVEKRRTEYRELSGRNVYWPRYWSQGFIGLEDYSEVDQIRSNQ